VIALLLVLPLLRTVGLPAGRVLPTPVTLGAPPPVGPLHHQNVTTIVQSNLADNVLIEPSEVPNHVVHIDELEPPPQVSFNTSGVPGGTGDGSRDGVWRSLVDSVSRPAPLPVPAPAPTVRPFRTSNLLAGSLVNRVRPDYPYAAKMAHVQGEVVLAAVISKDGTIENLRAITGHPMLVRAAIEAVSRWRYRPYILNGEPVEVETQIVVNFSLSAN
jgi:protein TonB